MFQEMMCIDQKDLDFLYFILMDWCFCTLDVVDMSNGLVTRWNSNFDAIDSSILNLGIMVDLYAKDIGKELRLINVYGPYGERRTF
jgi:hypothetical protein